MEWKYFFAISGYILTACDPVLGASTIINVTLVDGETPNEGRVEYLTSDDSTWKAACGDGLSSTETSVICRQLGYPGVSKLFNRWPFGTSFSLEHPKLSCGGDEGNLADCSLTTATSCDNAGGVICYESGYIGCYTSVLGELQTPCENGVQNLTTPKCVSSCHASTGSYTSAGLYQGNMCLCGKASTTIDQSTKEADRFCSSPCTGRTIETCGGDNHIALFNITLYLQNTKRTASSPGCAEPTPTQTEGAVTTTVSSSTPTQSTLTSSTSSSLSSSLSSSSSSSPPPPSPQSASPPSSSPRPTSPSVPSTDHTTTEVMTSDVTPTTRTPTITETGVQGNIGLFIGAGAGGGILLLIIIILLVVFIIRRRRKVPTRTKENGPDPYMDLQPRPEADRTYQEMVITSTASSPKNRRKSSTIIKPVL